MKHPIREGKRGIKLLLAGEVRAAFWGSVSGRGEEAKSGVHEVKKRADERRERTNTRFTNTMLAPKGRKASG